MRHAERLSRLTPAATLAMNAAALELRRQGVTITSLAVGEPDTPPPPHVCAAAKAAVDAGHSRYTEVAGIPELRTAAAQAYSRMYGAQASAEHMLVSSGGKQALFNLFMALLDPGDEVIIPAPYWVSYPDMVRLAEGRPVHPFAGPEQGFKVTVDQLEAARTDRTAMLVFNSPANPTGACYTEEERDAILDWAMARNIYVVADEIYDRLVYAPATFAGCARWWNRYPERIALVNGCSKTYAMTGWRIGYVIAEPALVRDMTKIQGQVSSNANAIAQYAALAALTGDDVAVDAMRHDLLKRRDAALAAIASWEDVVCPKPDGAFYLFLDMRRLLARTGQDCTALCTQLLNQAHVATVPGAAFGAPGFIRLSYAVHEDDLLKALGRIHEVLIRIVSRENVVL